MLKRNSLRKYFTLILMFFTVVIGFSSWIIVGEKNVTLGEAPVTKAVCYFTDSSGNKKEYTRIEKALEDANSIATSSFPQTVYVIPNLGFEVKIYKDCVVNPFVTLCLPHIGTTSYDSEISKMQDLDGDGNATDNETTFSDSTLAKVNSNRVTFVTLNEDVVLTVKNGGALQIGGQFGREGQTMAGQTTGLYCELGMRKNSKIISYGDVECYGYIKELDKLNNGSVLDLKLGTLKCPLVIYDYKGGSLTLDISKSNICPFDIFDLPNIQSLMRIYSGVKVNAELRMVISALGLQQDSVNLIGTTTTNTMMCLKTGYIEWKYTPDTIGITSNNVGSKTKINVFGDFSFGSIKISKGMPSLGIGLDINTDNYFLPLSYKFQITVESGYNLSIDKKIKLMPGCNVWLKKDSNITINNSIVLYPSGYTETSTEYAPYPTGLPAAKIYSNGITNLTSNGCVGGLIETSENNAILGISSSSYSVTSSEFSTDSVTKTMQVYIDTNNSIENIASNKTFVSFNNYWKNENITLGKYNIKFNVNGGNTIADQIKTFVTSKSVNISETINSDVVPIRTGYTFKGWFTDSNFTSPAENYMFSPSDGYTLNLYAKWGLIDDYLYNIEITGPASSGYDLSKAGTYSNLTATAKIKNAEYEISLGSNWKIVWSTSDTNIIVLDESTIKSLSVKFTLIVPDNSTKTVNLSLYIENEYGYSQNNISFKMNTSGGCFSSDTLVTMGDGSQKQVKDIVPGEEILSFNHFNGEYESTKIAMLVNHGYDYYNVMNLEFSNGSKIKFMAQHGLFDVESKEYKVMTVDNYKSFIGKTYLQYDSTSNSNKEVILDNVYITNEYIEAYSILSSRNINAVAENILTMSTSTPGIFNLFELDDNYMVDKELMKQDIEKYGLVTYEEYKDYVPYELFYDFNFEYLNISIAKGLINEEEIARQIEWYYQMIKNGEIII